MTRSRSRRWIVGLLIVGAAVPAMATPGQAAGGAVVPTIDCVWHGDPTHPVAFFGYHSTNPSTVTIVLGAKNHFTPKGPTAKDHGQPKHFAPGTHPDVLAASFTTTLVWTIIGPDGQTHSATANAATPSCASEPFVPTATASVGPITWIANKQQYAADNVTLIAAGVHWSTTATSVCNTGVARPPTVTYYVAPWHNATAAGPGKKFGPYWFVRTRNVSMDPQALDPPFAVGNSTGWVFTSTVAHCDLGAGAIVDSSVAFNPSGGSSDVVVWCFVTGSSGAKQTTQAGAFTVGAPGCDTSLPGGGGGVRFR